jgi:hypothetical protein
VAYRKERFRLRFLGVSAEVASAIHAALPEANIRTQFRVPTASNVLLFELNEGIDLDALYALLDTLHLGPKQFEIWASVVTESDNGGIEVPGYVLELIRRTNCGVGLSFVSLGPENDGDETPPLYAPVQ